MTRTGTLTGSPSGLTLVRSTVARKSPGRGRWEPAGAMYRIDSTSRSWLVMTVSAGWFCGGDGHRTLDRARVLRRDEPGVQQRGEHDRGQLEGPVVDDEPDGAPGEMLEGHRSATAAAAVPPASSRGTSGTRWVASSSCSTPASGGGLGHGVDGGDAGSTGSARRCQPGYRPTAAGVAAGVAGAPVAGSRRMRRRAMRRRAAVPRRPRASPACAVGASRSATSARSSCASVGHAHDPGPLDDAHLAALLGHHDRDRVGVLGDAERGAMARAEPLGEGHLGERQQRGRGEHVAAADDHRPVVELGARARRSSSAARGTGRSGASRRTRRSPRARSRARAR